MNATGGTGTGAQFKISINKQTGFSVAVTKNGTSYDVNDTLTIEGNKFENGTNDMTFQVKSLTSGKILVVAHTNTLHKVSSNRTKFNFGIAIDGSVTITVNDLGFGYNTDEKYVLNDNILFGFSAANVQFKMEDAYLNITPTGGSGNGFACNVLTDNIGTTTIQVVYRGANYKNGDTLTTTDALIGNKGAVNLVFTIIYES